MDLLDIAKTIVIPLVAVAVWVLSLHYVVKWLRKFGKGYKFGERIASHLGMKSEFFFLVMGEGNILASNETILRKLLDEGSSEEQASVELAPFLEEGLKFYVRDFGRDEEVEKAELVIVKLVEDWGRLQEK